MCARRRDSLLWTFCLFSAAPLIAAGIVAGLIAMRYRQCPPAGGPARPTIILGQPCVQKCTVSVDLDAPLKRALVIYSNFLVISSRFCALRAYSEDSAYRALTIFLLVEPQFLNYAMVLHGVCELDRAPGTD